MPVKEKTYRASHSAKQHKSTSIYACGLEFLKNEKNSQVLIVFHDGFGPQWGRHKEVCREFAERLKIPVIMPDFFFGQHVYTSWKQDMPLATYPIGREDAKSDYRRFKYRTLCSSDTTRDTLDFIVRPFLREFLPSRNVQIGAVGLHLGGWMLAKEVAKGKSIIDFAVSFDGFDVHPRVNYESVNSLCRKISVPIQVFVCKMDMFNWYNPDQEVLENQRKKLGFSNDYRIVNVLDVRHGYMTRSQVEDTGCLCFPEVGNDLEKGRNLGMKSAIGFITRQFECSLQNELKKSTKKQPSSKR